MMNRLFNRVQYSRKTMDLWWSIRQREVERRHAFSPTFSCCSLTLSWSFLSLILTLSLFSCCKSINSKLTPPNIRKKKNSKQEKWRGSKKMMTCLDKANTKIFPWITSIQVTHNILVIIFHYSHDNVRGRYPFSSHCFLKPPNFLNLHQNGQLHQKYKSVVKCDENPPSPDSQIHRHPFQLRWCLHTCGWY